MGSLIQTGSKELCGVMNHNETRVYAPVLSEV